MRKARVVTLSTIAAVAVASVAAWMVLYSGESPSESVVAAGRAVAANDQERIERYIQVDPTAKSFAQEVWSLASFPRKFMLDERKIVDGFTEKAKKELSSSPDAEFFSHGVQFPEKSPDALRTVVVSKPEGDRARVTVPVVTEKSLEELGISEGTRLDVIVHLRPKGSYWQVVDLVIEKP